MNKLYAILAVLLVGLLGLAGCGGGQNNVIPPPGTSTLSLTVTDTPPVGVGILSFEATLTGAVLNPGSVDLLNGKTPRIEVKQLETENAFLNTANVKPGTYTSISLTFSNPEVTFLNGTASTVAGCAAGAACEINPAGTLTVTFTFPGGGITIASGTPSGLRLDISPSVILSAAMGVDFSVSGGVSVTQLATKPAGELEDLDDIRGAVQNLDASNKKFDLKTTVGVFTITTNASTQFEFESCLANDFTCLANGKIVEVDVLMQPGGTFLAKKIEFEDDAEDDELEGIVFKIDDATHFELVTLHELRDIPNVSLGNPVKVTLNAGAQFKVQTEGLTVPSALLNAFQGATDTSQLIPGQALEIRVKTLTPGTPIQATTDRVRLRMSRFTAKVSVAGSPNFTVNNLPSFFTATSVHVQTQTTTAFEGVAGASSLAVNDTVSLKGLLFLNGPIPANPAELIAKKVRKR